MDYKVHSFVFGVLIPILITIVAYLSSPSIHLIIWLVPILVGIFLIAIANKVRYPNDWKTRTAGLGLSLPVAINWLIFTLRKSEIFHSDFIAFTMYVCVVIISFIFFRFISEE